MRFFSFLLFLCLTSFITSAQKQLTNPVLDQNFPDPTVISANGKYYAYATNSNVKGNLLHIQVAVSRDLQHWEIIGDALPQKPSWADKDFWAPHVLYDSTLQKYVLFYSGESKDKNTGKCLGIAFSDTPEGPFIDKGSPLVCGKGFENIDPFAFIDPQTGKKLLYWGSDAKPIRVQEMADDWRNFKPGSAPKNLIYPGKEHTYDRLIEGAWVHIHKGKYYLFYSGDNCCGAQAHYAVMVARADHATGPFKTLGRANGTGNSVILHKNKHWLAPGHNSVFKDAEGRTYMAYHAIARNPDKHKGRLFCISPLHFKNDWPVLKKDSSYPLTIDWHDTITISNESINKDIEGSRANYGSQYGRMIRLNNNKWLSAYTVSKNAGYKKDAKGGYAIEIALSTDQGRHWNPISLVSEPGRDVDNAAFIQLPDGSILLGCRSVRWQESYRLPVFKSTDGGYNWKKISTIDVNEGKPGELGHPDKGIYEPHFYFLKNGRLAVMYANEKHVTENPSYSQIISEKISSDFGKSWGNEIRVAYEPKHPASRPGMPVWTKMKNGKYIVVYEICGPENCNIYYKTSDDGFHWSVGLGTLIPHQNGAPYILSLQDGTLVLTSNKGNISISNDYGKHWHLSATPWHPTKSYKEDWTQTIWSSLYQTGINNICIISSVKRKEGGHKILLRFGELK